MSAFVPTSGASRFDQRTPNRMPTIAQTIAAAKPTPFHGCGSRKRRGSPMRSASTKSLYRKRSFIGGRVGAAGWDGCTTRELVTARRCEEAEFRAGRPNRRWERQTRRPEARPICESLCLSVRLCWRRSRREPARPRLACALVAAPRCRGSRRRRQQTHQVSGISVGVRGCSNPHR
jgi:hypothetical protein